MKRLAREHPDLVRPITLNHETYEGRPVEGIEIATNPNARDGRPVFLQMGVHHAREWPSGEHAMEWAYELILGYRRGDARAKRLVETTRTIVVPVVNPDGFNASREAGQLYLNGDGADTDADGSGDISDEEFILAAAAHPNEYRRKNCRLPGDPAAGSCTQPSHGHLRGRRRPEPQLRRVLGRPRRRAATSTTQTYRGPAAFSEPETQNVRELVSSRQVTTLITNHTFSNLVLRPPGLASQGLAPDEPALKALGDSMAAENGYTSQYGWQLYDTTGTTEDWSYSATGGYGYTFEIGDLGFHPPFAETVAEWSGDDRRRHAAAATARPTTRRRRTPPTRAKHSRARRACAGRRGAAPEEDVRDADLRAASTFTDTLDTTHAGGLERRLRLAREPVHAPARGQGRAAGRPTGDPSPPQSVRRARRHHAVRELRRPRRRPATRTT